MEYHVDMYTNLGRSILKPGFYSQASAIRFAELIRGTFLYNPDLKKVEQIINAIVYNQEDQMIVSVYLDPKDQDQLIRSVDLLMRDHDKIIDPHAIINDRYILDDSNDSNQLDYLTIDAANDYLSIVHIAQFDNQRIVMYSNDQIDQLLSILLYHRLNRMIEEIAGQAIVETCEDEEYLGDLDEHPF